MNVTVTATSSAQVQGGGSSGGQVLGASTTTQPQTGVGVLGMATMFSAAPLGVFLSRYGRGRVATNKKELSLEETAFGIFSERQMRKVKS